MSRARHEMKKTCKASGGGIAPVQAGGNPRVFEEAKARKKGGKVVEMGAEPMAKRRADKPHRASGGRVGADKNPFSSARATTSAPKR